jgi:thiol-disulfide isomerase/thioredoxin
MKHRKTQKQVRKPKTVVGYVYAEWCGHCKALRPIWKQMKKILPMHLVEYEEVNSNKQDEHIAKINHKYGVSMTHPQGYPYIFKITGGQVHEYTGNRDAKTMAVWFLQGASQDQKTELQNAGSDSVFGKGVFQGGIKSKRSVTRSTGRTNKRWTQKSWFASLFD